MNRFWVFLIALSFFSFFSFGQAKRSTLRVRLSDGDLIKIAVNDRYFDKTGRSLTIGDLRGKRQYLKVYRFRPYADGRGGRAHLLFSGMLKLEKGHIYDAVVDVRTQQLSLTEVSALPAAPSQMPFRPGSDHAVGASPLPATPAPEALSPRLASLQQAMDRKDTDEGKLKIAKTFLEQPVTAEEVKTIASWFFFDDTRMLFIKAAYPGVTDKNQLPPIRDVFTEEATRNAFDQFLQEQR